MVALGFCGHYLFSRLASIFLSPGIREDFVVDSTDLYFVGCLNFV